MQWAIVGHHLAGEERDADDDEKERVQKWTGYKQTGPGNIIFVIYFGATSPHPLELQVWPILV